MKDFIIRPISITILLFYFTTAREQFICHSCFEACQNGDNCDCTSSNTSCRGDYCYVRFYHLSEDSPTAVTKGCTNTAPSKYMDTCQYVADNRTVECYCRGDRCNNIEHFHNYQIDPLPLVSCCECDGYGSDSVNGTAGCLWNDCLHNCTGNYCYNDLVGQNQGCGWGYSMSWQFLRNTHRVDKPRPNNSTDSLPLPWSMNGGDMTCAETYSDDYTFIRGCNCAYDRCNVEETAIYYVRNESEFRESKQHYCYAVHASSLRPITADVYRKSTTCPGHFCFVTLITSVVNFDHGQSIGNFSLWGDRLNSSSDRMNLSIDNSHSIMDLRPRLPKMVPHYELTAGCMLIDDENKVEPGCTIEWSEDEKRPSKKHCICASHICNYYDLITGEDKKSLLAFDWKISKDYKTISVSHVNCPKVSAIIVLIILLVIL